MVRLFQPHLRSKREGEWLDETDYFFDGHFGFDVGWLNNKYRNHALKTLRYRR